MRTIQVAGVRLLVLTALASLPAHGQCPVALVPSTGHGADFFGYSVAGSEDTVVLGAPNPYGTLGAPGSAYVFERGATGWSQVAQIAASDGAVNDAFGFHLDHSGDRILVGAYAAGTVGHGVEWGRAYVYERAATGWSETAQLGASDASAYDWFGFAVALDGDAALVAALGDDDLRGSAYLFELRSGAWTEVAKFVAPDGSEAQAFGSSVALDGTVAVVGAPLEGAGSAYVYERIAGTWVETAELTAGASELFGYRVAVADPWLFVSLHVDSTVTPDGGSVYAYRREIGGWQLAEILRASDASAGHIFGSTLSARGNRLAVAALEVSALGAVYIFERGPSGWTEIAKLAGPSDTHATGFGRGLDLAPDALHVGAYEGDGTPAAPGVSYVFEPLVPPQVYTYCESEPNSAGAGAHIGKTGTTRIGRNDFRLTTVGLPPNGFALFFCGGGQVDVPFGDGRLCVAPGTEGLFRLDPPIAIDGLGEAMRWLDFTQPAAAAIEAGSSWNFQCWYRDAAMGATGFNSSDGLSARFCP